MNPYQKRAFIGVKESKQSRYKTTCLLLILIQFSVFLQFDKPVFARFYERCEDGA